MTFFENPKLRYKKLLIVLLPIFLVFLVMVFLSYRSIKSSFGSSSSSSNNKTNSIESMDYHLRDNATEYQIELFKELDEAVKNENEQEIVEGVAKNFIADAYTWTNKEDMWDVGGMCYVYSRYKTTTYYELRDSLYQLMARSKRELKNDEDLLEVTNVEITSCTKRSELFEIEENKYEAYDVSCYITYSGDKVKGYMTHNQYLTIIKNTNMDGRYEIAASYGD